MNRTGWKATGLVAVALGTAVVWVSVRAAILPSGPAAPAMTSSPERTIVDAEPPVATSAVAKAVVVEKEHVFGVIDPTVEVEHTFLIRNEGQAPLELSKGGTSCQCTTSELPKEPIPPGMGARIKVASKLENESGEFAHTALILTNDPTESTIELSLRGVVRQRLATWPANVVVSNVRRNKPIAAEFTVYSQVWEDFVVDDVKCSQEGIEWGIEPADAEMLKARDAKLGYRLQVTLPAKNKGGGFSDSVELSIVSPENTDKPQLLKVPISGSVPATVQLSGEKFQPLLRTVDLGPLRPREGARQQLVLRVNDEHRDLTIREIKTKPEFLQVKVTQSGLGEDVGLYAIDIEVPRTAPPCNWFTEKGEVVIVTDHPRVPEVKFKVAFAVLSR